MEYHGSGYGGFFLPKEHGLTRDSVVYCVGVGEDVSFDLSVAAAAGCDVYLYDPTPRAITHVQRVHRALETGTLPAASVAKEDGGGIGEKYWHKFVLPLHGKVASSQVHFAPLAIDVESDTRTFYPPRNPTHVSHSLVPPPGTVKKDGLKVQCTTLAEAMARNGHDHIDLLKLDIEGSEVGVIRDMLERRGIRPKYLCVDMDSIRQNMIGLGGRKLVAQLQSSPSFGYELLHTANHDYTFRRKE